MRHHTHAARRFAWLISLVAMLAAAALPAAAQAGGTVNDPPKVMTRNLYLGADLTPSLTPIQLCLFGQIEPENCLGAIAAGNQVVWDQVQATNFPARAKQLAIEIDDDDPYLVGLQEVALWRSDPSNTQGVSDATQVDVDFLGILLAELKARGNKYRAAVVQQEADIEGPALDGRDHRLTMRDVILARTDLRPGQLTFSSPQRGGYANILSLPNPLAPNPVASPIEFKRGWTSLDARINGKPAVRFVNTHLESFASGIRQAQAYELVGGFGSGPLLNPSLPAVIVGDLNSDPGITYGGDPTSPVSDGAAYGIIAGAGFVGSGNEDETFGHDADLLDDPSDDLTQFTERIDHVLTRASPFGSLSNKVVGREAANRTPDFLWPSDHAGLIVGIN